MIFAESSHQRISFAGDLGQSDKALTIEPQQQQQPSSGLVRRDTTLLDSDFEFHTSRSFDSSPADEIFADGMILPFQVTTASTMPKRRYKYELPPIIPAPSSSSSSSLPPPPQPLPSPQQSRKYCQKEETPGIGNGRAHLDSEAEKSSSSKSFWSFTRSSSLNCDIKKSLICSFPRLTRSISTGSVMNSKRAMLDKHCSLRHGGVPRPVADTSSHLSSSCPPSSCCSSYQFRPQKHTVGSSSSSNRGGSFRVTPVIGGPSPSGLGSILRLSKDKKTKNTK